MTADRVAIACLWRGDDLPRYSADVYDADYVSRLRRALNRYGIRLALMTDEHYHDVGRTCADIHYTFAGHGVGGWSNILEIFRSDLWPEDSGRLVALGLDTIITGDPSWLWEWDAAPIGLPMDPYATHTVCDAAISWSRPGAVLAWDAFLASKADGMKAHCYAGKPSEMALLRDLWGRNRWQTFDDTHDGKLLSFKVDVEKAGKSWRDATAVYFHGNPKPADLPAGGLRKEWEG